MGADAYRRLPVYSVAGRQRAQRRSSPPADLTAAVPAARPTVRQRFTRSKFRVRSSSTPSHWRGLAVPRRAARHHRRPQPRRVRARPTSPAPSPCPTRSPWSSPAPPSTVGIQAATRVAALGITAGGRRAVDRAKRPAGWNSRWSIPARRSWCPVTATPSPQWSPPWPTRGQFAREIAVSFPAHTSAAGTAARRARSHGCPRPGSPTARCSSSAAATGDVVAAGTDFADYWYGNLRNTVRFDRAVAAAVDAGQSAFVELSAHPALLFAMGDVLGDAADLAAGPVVLVGSGHGATQPLADRTHRQHRRRRGDRPRLPLGRPRRRSPAAAARLPERADACQRTSGRHPNALPPPHRAGLRHFRTHR